MKRIDSIIKRKKQILFQTFFVNCFKNISFKVQSNGEKTKSLEQTYRNTSNHKRLISYLTFLNFIKINLKNGFFGTDD